MTSLAVSPVSRKASLTVARRSQVPIVQRACHCGGTCASCRSKAPSRVEESPYLQAKLKVGPPDDRYEREADRVADQVMRMPEQGLQRQVEDEEEEMLQTKPGSRAGGHVEGGTASVSGALASAGRPLDSGTRSFMERRFGHGFDQVRVHTGTRAAESAQAVNAVAYTVGRDVVFDENAYRPETNAGRRLIAHELTHVLQQRSADAGVQSDSENEFGDSGVLRADRRLQRQEACYCCVSSVAIKNVSRIDNTRHMGHSYDFEINMTRTTEHGPRREPNCTLEWWEKTNVPYTTGMAANTWTNMFRLLPTSPTLSPWHNRSTACDTSSTVTINDPPALGKRPGRTVTRTLEFDLKVRSGPGGTCANSVKSGTATQVLAMVNGAPDWANSSFV